MLDEFQQSVAAIEESRDEDAAVKAQVAELPTMVFDPDELCRVDDAEAGAAALELSEDVFLTWASFWPFPSHFPAFCRPHTSHTVLIFASLFVAC